MTARTLIGLAGLLVTSGATATPPDASILVRWCSKYTRALDGGVLEPREAVEAASCHAYLRGVIDAHARHVQRGGKPAWCPPGGTVNLAELARLAAELQADADSSMIEALDTLLGTAHPCEN